MESFLDKSFQFCVIFQGRSPGREFGAVKCTLQPILKISTQGTPRRGDMSGHLLSERTRSFVESQNLIGTNSILR